MTTNPVHGALFGVAIGDALGVPAEFKDRSVLRQDPVTDFIGFKKSRATAWYFFR
ncbi:MAG: ADP-ribosylglycohydrolase family protein [Niastella sp.]|uniref:ADP-ribosylglycohydrolase family protein n=1 Tax=Niastella sp. TaxID=1869183 RepID=UPI00389A0DE2